MRDLDSILMGLDRQESPISTIDAAMFFTGMKKLAEDPVVASAMADGPFLAPLPEVVSLMSQIVSGEFKSQVYYTYYANMLRGLMHGSIEDMFTEHAGHELEHANYILRRISVLSPGGISIPPYPPPPPMTDPQEIIHALIVLEEEGITLWKQLHSVCGEDSTKFTVEQYLQQEEEHLDELWQLVEPAGLPEQPGAPMGAGAVAPPGPGPEVAEQEGPKTASEIFKTASLRKQASHALTRDELLRIGLDPSRAGKKESSEDGPITNPIPGHFSAMADSFHKADQSRKEVQAIAPEVLAKMKAIFDTKSTVKSAFNALSEAKAKVAPRTKTKLAEDMVVPEPGADSPEAYVAREQQLAAQQAMAEASHAKTVAMQSGQAAQQAQAQMQAAQQQLQQAQMQLQQSQGEAQVNGQKALQSQQAQAEAEARAAEHSVGKMQLGMRVNQLRQELANLVMQDPVSEHAATVSDLAMQGQPATPQQQQQAEMAQQQQAMMQQAGGPSADTKGQVQEAQNAQQDAQMQGAQAQQAEQQDAQKGQQKAAALMDQMLQQKISGATARLLAAEQGMMHSGLNTALKSTAEHAAENTAARTTAALGGATKADPYAHLNAALHQPNAANAARMAEEARAAKMYAANKAGPVVETVHPGVPPVAPPVVPGGAPGAVPAPTAPTGPGMAHQLGSSSFAPRADGFVGRNLARAGTALGGATPEQAMGRGMMAGGALLGGAALAGTAGAAAVTGGVLGRAPAPQQHKISGKMGDYVTALKKEMSGHLADANLNTMERRYLEAYKKHKTKVIGGAAVGVLGGGTLLHLNAKRLRKRHNEDMSKAVASGIDQAMHPQSHDEVPNG